MSEIKEAAIGENGSVTFVRKIPSRPKTTNREGNVTTINEAVAGVPAHYQVSFLITANLDDEGIETRNFFHWNCVVMDSSDRAQYRSVEDQAARQIAPMFRALADKIEAQLPNFAPSDHEPLKPQENDGKSQSVAPTIHSDT